MIEQDDLDVIGAKVETIVERELRAFGIRALPDAMPADLPKDIRRERVMISSLWRASDRQDF